MAERDHNERSADSLSEAKRKLLALRLRGARADASGPALPRRPTGAEVPATPYQEALWVHRQLIGDPAAYNIHLGLRIRGALDVAALQLAFARVAARHESLTTVLEQRASGLYLRTGCGAPQLTLEPLCGDPAMAPLLERAAIDFIRQAFDLQTGPLFRACVFRAADDDHLLLFAAHHVIVDEHSLGLLLRELLEVYRQAVTDRPGAGYPPGVDYGDYALHVRDQLAAVRERQIDYWRDALSGVPDRLDLPTDRARPVHATYRGALVTHSVGDGLIAALQEIAGRGSLFPVLLAGLDLFLARYTGQHDIAVGSPVSLRKEQAVASMIGLFVNPIVLRTRVPKTGSVRDYLADVRARAIAALAHADLPFEEVVAELAPRRDPGHNPFFQVMFVLETNPGLPDLPGLELTPVRLDTGGAKFDLSVFARIESGQLILTAEYNSELFEGDTVAVMLHAYAEVLAQIAARPDGLLEDIALLSGPDAARDALLRGPDVAYDADRCLPHRLQERATARPAGMAVIGADQRLTYADLGARVAALAAVLGEAGGGRERPVVVLHEQGVDYLVGMLGILRTGAAYVPVDPEWPDDRLRCVFDDVRANARGAAALAVVGDATEARAVELGARPVRIPAGPLSRDATAPVTSQPGDLAYVIYTSGSTGRPKGVAVEHGNLLHSQVARLAWYDRRPGRFLLVSPLIFDSSVAGIFWTLETGGTLVLPAPEDRSDPRRLAALLAEHLVTHILLLPSLYELLLEVADAQQLASLQTVIVAGESCPARLVDAHHRRLPGVELVNEYGPTEATVWSTAWRSGGPGASVCIGSPVANTPVWVVDCCLQPLPTGAAGELVIGGGGVARGYFNAPGRDDGPFIRIPALSDERLYRTGDRVRRRGDGMLEYLGRVDDQLKVRGYRIEPAAIETLLRVCDGIADAAVVAQGAPQGAPDAGAVLVAWCVADGGTERTPDVDTLRAGLRRRLPEYMVPARFEWLGELPRTPTGKPDRRALAARSPVSVAPGRGPRRPLSETEATVAQIWRRLLHTDLIDADDNFFDLGGQSLLGVRLLLEVEQAFGCALPLAALFESPTLAGFASRVLARHSSTDFQYVSPVWTGGRLTPLFCVHGAIRRLLPHLGTRRPVYLVYRQFDSDTFADLTVERLAAAYLEEIRRIQPHGPYHLCGFSFGGQVAYEIARILRAEGETVGLLGLLDPPPVGGSAYTRVLASRKLAQIRSVRGVVPRLAFVVREIPAGLARMLKRRWLHALARYRERRGTPMATVLLQERDRRNYIRASQTYRYREYPGSALLVMPERVEEILATTTAAFDELIQQTLDVHIIRGARAHEDMMRDPFGETLADILVRAMRDAETRTPLDNASGAPEPGSTTADPRPA